MSYDSWLTTEPEQYANGGRTHPPSEERFWAAWAHIKTQGPEAIDRFLRFFEATSQLTHLAAQCRDEIDGQLHQLQAVDSLAD